jgi:hypothetical protein
MSWWLRPVLRPLLFLGLFLSLFLSGSAIAESEGVLSRLLAPGPMIDGHKKLEGTDCLKCHDAGKGVPDGKCLDCHKELKPFVANKTGFHGSTNKACIECHTDHKGRDLDTVAVDTKNFDHFKLTGYKLEGKHADVKCQDCHKEKRANKFLRPHDTRYLGKISNCNSCHKKDDVHFFKAPFATKDCNTCHGLKAWKENLKFDHSKDTKFKLEGKHSELKCNDCHVIDKKKKTFQYKWQGLDKKQCLSCHQDQHKNNLSPRYQNGQCTTCHGQNHWKIEKFNHDAVKYPLKFKHEEAACEDCHKQGTGPKTAKKSKTNKEMKNFNWTGLKTACLSCHEDFHKFAGHKSTKMGDLNQCSKCHTENDWKKIHDFTHNQSTRYPVDGKHLELKCAECHIPTNPKNQTHIKNKNIGIYHWDKLDTKTCENCHANPHIGQFKKELLEKKCSTCHTTESWSAMKAGTGFDHSKTRFPLLDSHTKTTCASCHNINGKQVFKFKSFEQKFCIDCHNNVHKDQFSAKFSAQNCSNCHSAKTFTERLPFKHEDTNFALTGAHEKTKCSECHTPTTVAFVLTKPNISAKDLKAGGRQSMKSQYHFMSQSQKFCIDCHDNVHKDQFSPKFAGQNCTTCHSTKNFTERLSFNHSTTSYTLKGAHEKLNCNDCHTPTKTAFSLTKPNINPKAPAAGHQAWKGLFKFPDIPQKACLSCHQDYHKGQLGNDCLKCHNESSWKTPPFDHTASTRFPLLDKHKDVDCKKCHLPVSGEWNVIKKDKRPVLKYRPTSSLCVDCHKDVHKGSFGKQCQECHSAREWKSTKDFHKNFTLNGVHYTLECAECHKDGRKLAGLSQQCLSCHQKDDPHTGTLPNCKECHRQQFWEVSGFKHSMTRFPLRGAHRTAECIDCHYKGGSQAMYQGLNSQCQACHASDFTAAGAISQHATQSSASDCSQCHRNQFSFKSAN